MSYNLNYNLSKSFKLFGGGIELYEGGDAANNMEKVLERLCRLNF